MKNFHHAAFSDFLKTSLLSQNYSSFLNCPVWVNLPAAPSIDVYIAYSALMINIDDRNNLPRARCFSASEAAIRIGHIRSRDRMVFQSHAIIGWSMVWLWWRGTTSASASPQCHL